METPNGKKMKAVPFTVQFVTWFAEDKFPSYVPQEVLEKMCRDGFVELSADHLAGLNKNWSEIYVEVAEGVNA